MLVSRVEQNSIADELGILPGDTLRSINGKEVRDAIDYESFMAESELLLLLESAGGEAYEAEIEKEPYEPLGLAFENDGFGKKAVCANKCLFCFVDQMPKGMRPTLYVKDDDWRMSFLMGSYITLTNLEEEDITRIIAQKISPLYVSVHAGNDSIRTELLQTRRAAQMFEIIERFAANSIAMHTQVVLCEGINDGAILKDTLERLYGLYPGVLSVAIVPVGLTKYRDKLHSLTPVSPACARESIGIIQDMQAKSLQEHGARFAFAADELYIRAGSPLPGYEDYEDFCQIENGVGLIAKFLREVDEALVEMAGVEPAKKHFVVATGTDGLPCLRKAAQRISFALGIEINVYPIENRFFGDTVTVSGLVTGQDLIGQLEGKLGQDVLLLPAVMFREQEDVMLDGVSPVEIESTLGVECRIVDVDGYCFVEQFLK